MACEVRSTQPRPILRGAIEQPAAILRAAADIIRVRAADKGIDIVTNLPPGLPAVGVDLVRFGNALQNLLDNALAYTERGGRITLTASATGDKVSLSVADTGIGIPPEHLPHVFDRFFRVPGQSRAGGTGLGLAIVREIVAAHGGVITCESRIGEGAVFHISLPVHTAVATAAGIQSADPEGTRL